MSGSQTATELDPPSEGSGRLLETARLYVRASGPATLQETRRFVAEFPSGAYCPALRAETAAFELVSTESGTARARMDPSSPDANGIADWIHSLCELPICPAHPEGAKDVNLGDEVKATSETRLTAIEPLWLIASEPRLVVSGPQISDVEPSRFLPVLGKLCAACTEDTTLRVTGTDEVLHEYGHEAIGEAARHIAAAIAAWHADLRQAEGLRVQQLSAHDDQELRAAYGEIASVADARLKPAPIGAKDDPLLAAIHTILERDGMEIRTLETDTVADRVDQRLPRIALASHFRYREVSLQEQWWLEDGPPLLVWRTKTDQPLAAVWHRGRYHLLDPMTRERLPMDGSLESEVLRSGFMIYPSLPAELAPGDVRRFATSGVRADFRAILSTGVIALLIGLVVPVATGAIVGTAVPQGRLDLLVEMAILVGAAAIGMAAFQAGRSLATIRASTLVEWRLQAAIWDRVLRLAPRFFRDYSTGDLVLRVLAVDQARRVLTGPVLGGIISGLFAGLSFLLMFIYDWGLAMYGLLFAALIMVTLFGLTRKQLTFLQAFREAEGWVTGRIVDTLIGVSKLRLAAAEERAFARWAEAFSAQQRANWRSGRIRALRSVMIVVLPSLGVLGMFVVAGYRGASIDLAAFAAFNAAFGQFIAAISVFGLSLSIAVEAIPLLRRAKPILDARPEVDKTRAEPARLSGRIVVRDLSFRYRDEGPLVLDRMDFAIEPGQFVAVVGPSGSGKSTLLRMLLGFETPASGAVFYGDVDLARLDLRLVRRQIGTVLQNAGLTLGSIYENIAGAAMLSDETVMEAARQAGIADDIKSFPMGLETLISEDASTISGGQRQRIMIARALVKKPPILFFDEATSALDNRTQAIVSESLDQLRVTRLVVAHRLSTIRNANKILVIEKGRIVESGRYDELMERKGAFFRLAERQLV